MEGQHSPGAHSRRRFLGAFAALFAAPFVPLDAQPFAGALHALLAQSEHPEPRANIDASKVLTEAELEHAPHLVRAFNQVREIPQIADGIRCYCGCARVEGYRSLLSCYEKPGMAQHCVICQGQGKLAYSRWKEGQDLEQIRRAIDARYGHGAAPAAEAGSADHCRR